jgi:aerobic C4-dicarboxylate transport protein
VDLLEVSSEAIFEAIALIMRFAPLGALGAMAFTIGKYGISSLLPLGRLLLCVYLTCLAFIFGVLGMVARWSGFSILRFLRYIGDEILIVLGTSSSEAALPSLMEKLESVGCERSVVGLVVPAGYSFNLDGTAIYLTVAAIFVAQATDVSLSIGDQLAILGVLLVTSKGAAAVTGSGFITLAATLSTTGKVPLAGLALLIGIDRFMSEARAITNLIGNGVATVVVAGWEGKLDRARLKAALDRNV